MATAEEIRLYGRVRVAAHLAADKVSNVAILASAAARHCRFVVTMTTSDTDHEKNILDAAHADSNSAIVTLRGVRSVNKDPATILETVKAALKVAKAAFTAADKACGVIPDESEKILEGVRTNIELARDAYQVAIAAIECAEAAREDTLETEHENEMLANRRAADDLWEKIRNARLADRQEFQRILHNVITEKKRLERQLSEANTTAESEKEQLQRQLSEAKSEKEQLQRRIHELQTQKENESEHSESLLMPMEVPLEFHFPDQMATDGNWSLVDEVAVVNAELVDVKRQLKLKRMREEIDTVNKKLAA